MAISKKGLRKIVVANREFYWKFNENIFVISDEAKNGLLVVDFGWYDVWLYINDKENRPPDFEPKSVTPKFVSESITYALTQGWDDRKMEIEFRNGVYKKK
ncbi:hypothetical protein [Zunongwangia sp.]|uniref:hypothetical protein n=1 Tax=Zunongwangia sp. TaxID=1965325 RepID=UPI003AA8021F